MDNVTDHFVDALVVLRLGEKNWAVSPHPLCISLHDAEVCANCGSEVGLVDHKKIGLGEAGAAFSGNFIAAGHVDNLDGKIGQLAAETGSEIVAARFEQKDIGFELAMQFFQREQVCRDVFTNGRMRATTGLDRADPLGGQGFMTNEKFAVFLCKNVVSDGRHVVLVAQVPAQLEHQRGFAAPDGAADANRESAS